MQGAFIVAWSVKMMGPACLLFRDSGVGWLQWQKDQTQRQVSQLREVLMHWEVDDRVTKSQQFSLVPGNAERDIHYVHAASLAYEDGIVFMSEADVRKEGMQQDVLRQSTALQNMWKSVRAGSACA